MSLVSVENRGEYSILTLKRPEAKNALNRAFLGELRETVQGIAQDRKQRVLIVTGDGSAFCAGADIAEMKGLTAAQAEEFARNGHDTMNAIAGSDLISIAALNGHALGGGLELALSCDLRIASNAAKLGLPEVGLGLLPGFGGTQRLSRLVGRARAVELVCSGELMSAEQALGYGLVQKVTAPEQVLPEAIAMAEKFIKGRAPGAQKTARWLVISGMELPLSAGIEREINAFAELFNTREPVEGLSAFLEKRPPNFT
ncbi:MAG: enoyl-CoA hydratase/isomerase family protein [Leptospirales bacterium]|nr:enoyl-CoA hydratase/isomerase family protein [Leptospirales bacterium]